MSASDTTPAVVIRTAQDGTPWWEAKWRDEDGRQRKRRIKDGPAWVHLVEVDGKQVWERRPGKRVASGYVGREAALRRAVELAAAVAEEACPAAAQTADRVGAPPTFRRVAHEWLVYLRKVKGAKPSTLRDYEALLREPGQRYKRGTRESKGRIMSEFGDREVRAITAADVASWLGELDDELTARNVNKHRQVVCSVLGHACRADTYGLEVNVAAQTDKRREPPTAALDYYEVHEVEALAEAVSEGAHRGEQPNHLGRDERLMRAEEDARDADFFRVLLYTGMRLGELRALRWGEVDLNARTILVSRNVSAGEEVSPKGGRSRWVPLPARAVEVLRRQAEREHFTSPDDYVFAGRLGGRLDDSALRRRYHGARDAIGLRKIKLHGLRHAAGSLVARNAQAVELRDFMGHRKLTTTDRYVSAKFSAEFMGRLDAAFEARSAERAG